MSGLLKDDLDTHRMHPNAEEDDRTLGPLLGLVARLTWPVYGALVVLFLGWALVA
jgi:hypothetical protein